MRENNGVEGRAIFSRRSLLSILTALPLAHCLPRLSGVAMAQTGGEAIAIGILVQLAEGYAYEFGAGLARGNNPPDFYKDLTKRLDKISLQIAELTELVISLPDVIQANTESLLRRDLEALVNSNRGIVDDIIQGSGGKLSQDQRAQLNVAVVNLTINIDRLWQYGIGVYPVAIYGTILTITMHRLLGTAESLAQVKQQVERQIATRLEPLTLVKVEPSFAQLAIDSREAAAAKRGHIAAFPRAGVVGCRVEVTFVDRPVKTSPGVRYNRLPVTAEISPVGVPDTGEFTVSWNRGAASAPFPGVEPDLRCTKRSGQRQAQHVLSHLNGQLNAMRSDEGNAVSFAAASAEIAGCIKVLRQLVA